MTRGVTARTALTLGALGVVFGDIGTSPIYTIQTRLQPRRPASGRPTRSAVYGVISLIFWAVTIIVTIKYVLLIMRADNDGEGGIMALITLIAAAGAGRPGEWRCWSRSASSAPRCSTATA